ncbi:MAG: hypothetical protein M3218_03795 [Thermoproteota archaeon]|nr:hypothetical protein [Thermoproteota archaeon]
MAKLSKKETEQEQQQQRQQAKNGYWQNELESLGIEPNKRRNLTIIKKNLKT